MFGDSRGPASALLLEHVHCVCWMQNSQHRCLGFTTLLEFAECDRLGHTLSRSLGRDHAGNGRSNVHRHERGWWAVVNVARGERDGVDGVTYRVSGEQNSFSSDYKNLN